MTPGDRIRLKDPTSGITGKILKICSRTGILQVEWSHGAISNVHPLSVVTIVESSETPTVSDFSLGEDEVRIAFSHLRA